MKKIEIYISLKLSEDLEDSKYIELSSVVSYIAKELSVATSFEESELLGYGEKYINKLLKNTSKSPHKNHFLIKNRHF